MKFSTGPTIKKPVVSAKTETTTSIEDMLSAQCYMNQVWSGLSIAHDRLNEVSGVLENLNMTVDAITKYGQDAIKVINIDKSLENLLGVEEKFITADKAMEGLGEAIKNAWESFKEWVKKIAIIIRNWIGKVFQTAGHQQRTVAANIDKVDFDAKLYVMDAEHLDAMPQLIFDMLATIHAWMGKFNGYKNWNTPNELVDINTPFMDRLSMAAQHSGGIFVFDKDTGKMEINTGTFVKKEQSLKEAGWGPNNLKALYNPLLPKTCYQIADSYYQYSTAISNIVLDSAKAVMPSENVREYINMAKAYTNAIISSLRSFMSFNHIMADVANQAYKTLPEDLKKRI